MIVVVNLQKMIGDLVALVDIGPSQPVRRMDRRSSFIVDSQYYS